jgi:hypothetical protein
VLHLNWLMLCFAVAKDLPVDDLKGQLMAAIEQLDDAKVTKARKLMLYMLLHSYANITEQPCCGRPQCLMLRRTLLCAWLHTMSSILWTDAVLVPVAAHMLEHLMAAIEQQDNAKVSLQRTRTPL